MSKKYIRRTKSLIIGGGTDFECKKCSKLFERKDKFKNHICLAIQK